MNNDRGNRQEAECIGLHIREWRKVKGLLQKQQPQKDDQYVSKRLTHAGGEGSPLPRRR